MNSQTFVMKTPSPSRSLTYGYALALTLLALLELGSFLFQYQLTQTQVAYAASTAAVEEWARTEGHYVKEGDHPVVPIEQPGSEPVVVATPTVVPTPPANWEIWWKLFFEK